MSRSGEAPWGAGVPEVVVTGYTRPGGDVGGGKCRVNDVDGVVRGQV